jgi:serine/threonine protein kinase
MDEVEPLIIIEPRQIGPYVLLGCIGEGAFSVVKLVRHESTGRFYAAKIVPRSRLDSEYLLRRFEIEIRTHQSMHHPGVVQLYDLFKDDNNFYVILEFCSNGELFQCIIDRGHFPEDEARPMALQMLNALQYVHAQGVTHRDLKPENVLIGDFGQVKLSDFGLSRFFPMDAMVGTPCGSPCYASPECLSGESYSGKTTDVWSLGVIVFAMVTGQLPWTKTNQAELFEQIRHGDYIIPPSLTEDCGNFLRGLLTVSPSERLTIEEAISHPWLRGTKVYSPQRWIPAHISLRKLDRYFDRDVPKTDFLSDDDGIRRNASSSSLSIQEVTLLVAGRHRRSDLPALTAGQNGVALRVGTSQMAIRPLARQAPGIPHRRGINTPAITKKPTAIRKPHSDKFDSRLAKHG